MSSRADLVIINPGAAHGIYGSDLANSLVAKEPPLWARLIAGYVRDMGFSVRIIDAEAEDMSPTLAAFKACQIRPRLVCIAAYGHQPSASTQQMYGAGLTAKEIKRIDPAQQIIMVGGHVAALPERTLREEAIDYACNGEGPATIAWLLRNEGKLLSDCPGLVWKMPRWDGCEFDAHSNPHAPLIPIDELHGNAWDLLPLHLYRAHNWQCFGDLSKRQPYASIYTSLGCPYKCSFCCIQAPFSPELNGNRYRMRDPAKVVSEILMLEEKYGVRTVKVVDEMFVLNERHYTAICNGLIEAGYGERGGNIWAYARIDTVKPHTLEMFRKAGIKWLALGIESGSKHVRDGAEKALKSDDISGVVESIRHAGINIIGNYIFGLPDDDLSSMRDTLDLALSLNTDFANFYCAMAYPGSKLYTEALEKGWTLPPSWRAYSQHNDDCRPLDTEHVSAADVLRFRDEAFQTYFANPAYLAMIEKKFGAETLAHVQDMTKYRLKRKLLGD